MKIPLCSPRSPVQIRLSILREPRRLFKCVQSCGPIRKLAGWARAESRRAQRKTNPMAAGFPLKKARSVCLEKAPTAHNHKILCAAIGQNRAVSREFFSALPAPARTSGKREFGCGWPRRAFCAVSRLFKRAQSCGPLGKLAGFLSRAAAD